MVRNFMQTNCPRCGEYRNGTHRTKGCGVTTEMWAAILKFKSENGRTWKRKLVDAWTRGENLGCELQQVRNIIGPSRLYKINA